MSEPTIALVFTPDPWVEEVHRHCTDHGGARVRQVLIDPALALEEQYDVLVVSHRWSALTHGFVDDVRDRGCAVLGVYDREEPAGRELLHAVGADATVASDAGAAGIVAALRALHGDSHADAHRRTHEDTASPTSAPLTVVSGPTGAGATEIAIALAITCGPRAFLVDADDVAPAVAARLGLPLEPNIRGAIDAVEHTGDGLEVAMLTVGALRIVAGLPSVAAWPQLRPPEVLRLVHRLAATSSRVVVDAAGSLEDLPVAMARPRHALARALIGEADDIVAVGAASPVGVARLLAWVGNVRALAPRTPVHVVMNRAPNDAFRRGEIVEEITAAFPVTSVSMVPEDRRVVAAAWAGSPVARGAFTRAVVRLERALEAPGVEMREAS
ncbi:MAG: hypothetical protein JWL83_1265 [Actinomycetia bacterium]|nr:hypothetical protein [Actinomycetes bacterium]